VIDRSTRALAAALALALLPASARGEEALGVLAVAEAPGPGPELVALAGELRAALSARTQGVLGADALRARMSGYALPSALGDLDRAYAGAVAAHAAGEFEPANRTLRSVVEALEALPEGPELFAAWTRATLRLARSEQELGRGVEAQAVLERLLRAVPDLRADPRQYPPSFQRLVADAGERLRALGTRRLMVEAFPPARVFVEGREIGSSPISLDLPPGRYRVAGRHGGIRATSVVDLSEDRTVQLDLSIADALRPDAGPGLALPEPGRVARVLTAAARLSLDRAVMAEVRADGEGRDLAAALLDVRRGVAQREGRIHLAAGGAAVDAVDALAGFLLTGEASRLVVPAAPSLALSPEGAERALHAAPNTTAPERRRSSALGWSAVGTGVAAILAGTAAVIYGRDAQGRYDDARAMLDGSGRVAPPNSVATYNAALSAGDRRRDAAIGLGIGAGVSAATTAVLAYVSWRRTGEIGPFRF
jgi:hypothetical protein